MPRQGNVVLGKKQLDKINRLLLAIDYPMLSYPARCALEDIRELLDTGPVGKTARASLNRRMSASDRRWSEMLAAKLQNMLRG